MLGRYIGALQATAGAWAASSASTRTCSTSSREEIVRGTAAAPLSQMLRALDPVLREMAHMGAWNIISPGGGVRRGGGGGRPRRDSDQDVLRPTILVSRRVGGEEDIPMGVVGVITPDMPDILSHVSVRARNEGCLFATVFDAGKLQEMEQLAGQAVKCTPSASADDLRRERPSRRRASLGAAPAAARGGWRLWRVRRRDERPGGWRSSIRRREFMGRHAVPSPEFTVEIVGSKSRNLQELRGRLPDWINLPASAALPFCTFDVGARVARQRARAASSSTAAALELGAMDFRTPRRS